MTENPTQRAWRTGPSVVQPANNALLLGEMGISNTLCCIAAVWVACRWQTAWAQTQRHRRHGIDANADATSALDVNAAATTRHWPGWLRWAASVTTLTGAVLRAAAELRVIVVDGASSPALPCWWPAIASAVLS